MRCAWLRPAGLAAAALIGACMLGLTTAHAAEAVRVLHADSMTPIFQRSIVPALEARGVSVLAEGRGSVANANLVRAGLKRPDVFISADVAVLEGMLPAREPVATTRLVLAYSPRSRWLTDFQAVAAGRREWYDVLSEPGVRFARTDPAQDPRGYRTVQAVLLAERFYKRPLRERLLGDDRNQEQILSDDAILLRLDQGELDASLLYETQARARNLPYVALPPQIDLGDERFARTYAAVQLSVDGVTRTGAPIAFGLTIPNNAQNPLGAAAFVRYLIAGAGRKLLENAGFKVTRFALHGEVAAVPKDVARLR